MSEYLLKSSAAGTGPAAGGEMPLHFMEHRALAGPGASTFASFSGYWKQGTVFNEELQAGKSSSRAFTIASPDGSEHRVQSLAAAFWPDGSLKWTFHTADFAPETKPENAPVVEYGHQPVKLPSALTCKDAGDRLVIDTGAVQTEIFTGPNADHAFIGKTVIAGRTAIASGSLVYINESPADEGAAGSSGPEDALTAAICAPTRRESFYGRVDSAKVEEQGELQLVVVLRGVHVGSVSHAELMPFTLRLTLRLNDPFIRLQHTFTYTGDSSRDFMRGLGISLKTPLTGREYNRHIMFAGDEISPESCRCAAPFHEASKLLLSWHPRLSPEIYPAQISGKPLYFNPADEGSRAVDKTVASIPAWNSYHLTADSADHWKITKGTGKAGCSMIGSAEGHRTTGAAALSGEDGGIVVCQRDFWQRYPAALWFDNIGSSGTSGPDTARTSIWFWSPDAPAKDFRHYDTEGHAGSYYEGFDKLGSDPYGISATSEVLIGGFLPHEGRLTLSHEELDAIARDAEKPALLVASPAYYHAGGAFGIWSLPQEPAAAASQSAACPVSASQSVGGAVEAGDKVSLRACLEQQLSSALDFYRHEIDSRRWYGFFDYGDVMHTYDPARHSWRYDMGGYAWQNTELVPTLWLWYSFLRTGREDVYTMAEAMSRHTSEVDIYHEGKYKGLGSRHNVIHWGCPCKEARIAMAGHHRFAYYLGGDRRYGDIFDIVKDGDFATLETDPLAMFYDKAQMKLPTHARTGPDWSTYTSNWLTEWERHGQAGSAYEKKLRTGIADLKKAPLQLISGNNFEYDPATGHLGYIGENTAGGSHLAICMGGPQTWFELAALLDDSEWEKMLADFGAFYFLSHDEQLAKSGGIIGRRQFTLPFMAAGMGAYGARYFKDAALARKVWDVLLKAPGDNGSAVVDGNVFCPQQVAHCSSAAPIDELAWNSTNVASQYCLNVIVCLELIGGEL